MALRGYYRSPRSAEPYIESFLDIRDADGEVVPGYGWIFPLGDGRVNVGVGLLSTQGRWKQVNTTKLMDAFVAQAPASWCLEPADQLRRRRRAAGCRWASPSGPASDRTASSAATRPASINPFNGEGIAYGYETGRLAAATVADALARGRPRAARELRAVPAGHLRPVLPGRPGLHRSWSRGPAMMRVCRQHRDVLPPLMEWLLRIMANYLRPDELGARPRSSTGPIAALARQVPES